MWALMIMWVMLATRAKKDIVLVFLFCFGAGLSRWVARIFDRLRTVSRSGS